MYHMTALQLLDISLMPREFPHDNIYASRYFFNDVGNFQMIILWDTASKVKHLITQQIVDKSTFVRQTIFMHTFTSLKEVITKNFKRVDHWSNR